jgi:hypothetical protein
MRVGQYPIGTSSKLGKASTVASICYCSAAATVAGSDAEISGQFSATSAT